MTLDELKNLANRALRSDKYTQGRDVLKRGCAGEVCHCALGALAEEAGFESASYTDGPGWDNGPGWYFVFNEENDAVRGISVPSEFIPDDVSGRISWLNDTGSDFAEIADYIDALTAEEYQ